MTTAQLAFDFTEPDERTEPPWLAVARERQAREQADSGAGMPWEELGGYSGRLPERKRRMPSLWSIARHWAGLDVFTFRETIPSCFACLREVPHEIRAAPRFRWDASAAYLDRAHLVDHAHGGLDGPQNLVPMCRMCHAVMPRNFRLGDGPDAIDWVRDVGGITQFTGKVLAGLTEDKRREIEEMGGWRKAFPLSLLGPSWRAA